MSTEQLVLTIAVAPVLSLVIVLAGYIVQNTNLNARTSDMRSDLNARTNEMRTDFDKRLTTELSAIREVLRAELSATRAEMSRNHSEAMHKFADLDQRLTRIEAR